MVNGGPVLVVHGGAGALESEEDRRQYLQGVGAALDAGLAALPRGARAAVMAAVVHMERHTIMNAGHGAALARDGTAALDAGFMDGATRRYGAVTGVRTCMTPVLLAERLSHEGDYGRFVAPPGADALVAEFGLPACAPDELVTERARRLWERRRAEEPPAVRAPWLDTVGAVALDAQGHVAAAVSTGGMSLKRTGRVGDSPVVGGGFWADDRAGACVSTGVGEVLMREGTARRCVQLLAAEIAPARAAAQALAELADHPGDARGASGLILVSATGAAVLDHSSFEMSGGWARPDGSRRITHQWR
ncbi:MAG TPA: isoaspartyl peptidase/L-asparaginase [Planctomycetota bacterium]|nr:isoaspartyl peptidase/L-asparaginase [Planctomycetota bacterium]